MGGNCIEFQYAGCGWNCKENVRGWIDSWRIGYKIESSRQGICRRVALDVRENVRLRGTTANQTILAMESALADGQGYAQTVPEVEGQMGVPA